MLFFYLRTGLARTLLLAVSVCISHSLYVEAQLISLEQRRQRFMQGVQFYEDQQYQHAFSTFDTLRQQYPELHDYVLFFLGHTALKLQQNQQALDLFQEFLSYYPSHPLTHDVQLHTAHLLLANQEYTAARDLYRQLLGHPDLDQGEIYYRLGNTFLALDRQREAVFSYHQMVSYYPKHPARKQAQQQLEALIQNNPALRPPQTEGTMLKQARAFVEAQWYKSARAQYEAIKQRYPQSPHIEECEFGIVDALFRSGNYTEGMQALEQLVAEYAVKDTGIAARALYTIGSRDWNADRNTHARTIMQQLIQDYPQTAWADNATYVVGRIYQGEQAYSDAATWYLNVYAKYPGSRFAEESLWRTGWSFYLNTQYNEAVQTFRQVLDHFPDGSYKDDALYWLGRSQERLQAKREAVSAYQELIRSSPASYYGVKAVERLQAVDVAMPEPKPSNSIEPSIVQVVDQIQRLLPNTEYEQIHSHIAKIFELRQVDLRRHAGREVDWIVSLIGEGADLFNTKATRDHQLLLRYFHSRLYAEAGQYLKTIQWASRLEATLADEDNRDFTFRLNTFPYRLDTLKYPLGYWDIIASHATTHMLDPFLITAIIRQESAYNPDALSHADARGLMQVLPGTGKRVANTLNMKDFTASQLYDPETSILLGTAYLAELLKKFDQNLYRAIAAYNAGPKATSKWWPESGDVDPEVIIENISYRETRNYVKRVLRDQHQYRQLYQHLEKIGL